MSTGQYSGNERRRFQRRVNKDRRQMIRFEPEVIQRRSGNDRRQLSVWDNRV